MDLNTLLTEVFGGLGPTREAVLQMLPRVGVALLVLTLGWLVAWLLRAGTRRLVRRFSGGIPEGATGTAVQRAVLDRGAGRIVEGGVYWLVLLAAFMVATELVGLPVLTTWLGAIATYVPKIVLAFGVMLAGVVGGRLAAGAIEGAGFSLTSGQARRLGQAVQFSSIGISALVAASQLGLDVSLLTAVFLITLGATLGGSAFAFGLGARSVMANILAMHYVHRSYGVGQRIQLGGDEGRIVRTTATTVFIEHEDGEVEIPGQLFATERCVRLGRGHSNES